MGQGLQSSNRADLERWGPPVFPLEPGRLACPALKLLGSEVSLKINGKRLRTH